MNREEAKKLLPIIQAYADGKEIQHNFNGDWSNMDYFDFDDDPENYRIKLEPREYWLFKDSTDPTYTVRSFHPDGTWDEVIHVREVIE